MHSRQYNIPARLSMEVDEEDVWAGIISTSSLAASADRRNPDSSISDNLNLSNSLHWHLINTKEDTCLPIFTAAITPLIWFTMIIQLCDTFPFR